MQIPFLLISLSVGYFVFLYASKEKKDLKVLGRAVGIVVMLLSVAGTFFAMKCKIDKSSCPLMAKMGCNSPKSEQCSMMMGGPR